MSCFSELGKLKSDSVLKFSITYKLVLIIYHWTAGDLWELNYRRSRWVWNNNLNSCRNVFPWWLGEIQIVVFFWKFSEIKAVAALLGVSGVSLYRGLTTKTKNLRGQILRSLCDAATVSTAIEIRYLYITGSWLACFCRVMMHVGDC